MRRLVTLALAGLLALGLGIGPASATTGTGGLSGLVSGFSTTSESSGYGSPSTANCEIGQKTSPAVEYARCALEYDITAVPEAATITQAILRLQTASVPACELGGCFMNVAGYVGNAVGEISDLTAGEVIGNPVQMGLGEYTEINVTEFVGSLHEAGGSVVIAGFRMGRATGNPDDDRTLVGHPTSGFAPSLDLRYGVPETLTIDLAGTGDGRVTSEPPGIDCPGDCFASFIGSSTVILTAEAMNGGTFDGWEVGSLCEGRPEGCKFRMPDTATTIKAFFTAITPPVSAPPSMKPSTVPTPPKPSASTQPSAPATAPAGSEPPASGIATLAPSGFEPGPSHSGSIGSGAPISSTDTSGSGGPVDPASGSNGSPIIPIVLILAAVLVAGGGLFAYRNRRGRAPSPPA